jgi:hypothetical protein
MKHTASSRMFSALCSELPQHSQHVYARLITLRYLHDRYDSFKNHESLINKALHNLDH